MIAVREMPQECQPRYRAQHVGMTSLSTTELVQLVTSFTHLETAHKVLWKAKSLANLGRMSVEELTAIENVGPASAVALKAALELGRRLLIECEETRPQVRSPADIANLLEDLEHLDQEHFIVLLLDTKNRVIERHTLYVGTVNTSFIRTCEVFKEAIRRNATAIVVAHNHPSGDPTPSPEDVRTTERIVEAGKLLNIDVLDHVIIGRQQFVSLKERGLGF